MLLFTESVMNIKRYGSLSFEEKERMKNGGNKKFLQQIGGKIQDKYHSNYALQYRIEIALGLSGYDSDSTNYASPNKSIISFQEQKKRLDKVLQYEGLQQDYEWLQVQAKILTTDLKKKLDRNNYIQMIEQAAQNIIQKYKKQENQQTVFNAFAALIKK